MSYSYTDTYRDIRNYNKFDKILNEIIQKIKDSPDSFSKKEINGFKKNIKKLSVYSNDKDIKYGLDDI